MSSPFPPANNPFPAGGQPANPFGPQPQPFGPPGGFPSGMPGQPFPPYPGPASRLSILAVASMISGVAGLFTCCCSFVSIPASLLAIVSGHMSLIFINRAGSGLTGKPVAAIGLISGYLGLLMTLGLTIGGLMLPKPDPNAPPPEPTAASELKEAERKIATGSDGVAHGNTPAAIDLAKSFAEKMKVLRDENFTKGGKGISLSGGKFITYCELRPGQCALVVHVPEYRKFEDDAKDSLAELAWEAAQETVEGTLAKGDKLAVGMKGVLLYGSVMVGTVASPDDPKYGLDEQSEDDSDLYPFFEPEAAEAMEPPAIELPAEAVPDSGAKEESGQPAEKAPAASEAPKDEAAPANEPGPAP